MSKPPLDYQQAGVDIEAANQLVDYIKPLAKKTFSGHGVLGGIGGFGALYELPPGYRKPVLVSGTDGVGTKLRLALDWRQLSTIGQDLVAMCANDILVLGAKPLFFLDYYATGKLDQKQAAEVIGGIAAACEACGMALIGGETAELPGFYQGDDFDMAGFCVGIVEKDAIITPESVQDGDLLMGLSASGPHSNGYSLIRKIIDIGGYTAETQVGDKNLAQWLLQPTCLYGSVIQSMLSQFPIHGMAHITGGGLTENVPRFLTSHEAVIDRNAWEWPLIFRWLQQQGNVESAEMLKTFNCGIGMVICLAPEHGPQCQKIAQAMGYECHQIGRVESLSESSATPRVVWKP